MRGMPRKLGVSPAIQDAFDSLPDRNVGAAQEFVTEDPSQKGRQVTSYEFDTHGLKPSLPPTRTPLAILNAFEKDVDQTSTPTEELTLSGSIVATLSPSTPVDLAGLPLENIREDADEGEKEEEDVLAELEVEDENNNDNQGIDYWVIQQQGVMEGQTEEDYQGNSEASPPGSISPSQQPAGEEEGDDNEEEETEGEQSSTQQGQGGQNVEQTSGEGQSERPGPSDENGSNENGDESEGKGTDQKPNQDDNSVVSAQEEDGPQTTAGLEDEDNFLPVPDEEVDDGTATGSTGYYYVDLRPFSVFVDADRDLSSDVGIPLYLLLEMEETLPNLADIRISNLTIHMGVVRIEEDVRSSPQSFRYRRGSADPLRNHYHWNELFFEGVAKLEDSFIHSAITVQNVQSLVLSNAVKLQAFWNNQTSDMYSSLQLINITLLRPLSQELNPSTEAQEVYDIPPENTSTMESEESNYVPSKRASNVWIMVPLVLLFLLVCVCLIALCGRLHYLGSRAQERYNEKYGLDYNIYGDKDISKDIFNEEYLMSENDQSYSHNDSVRSIDFLTRPINTIKTARRNSKARNLATADDMTPTTDEEEEMQGSGEVREVFYNEGRGTQFTKDKDEEPRKVFSNEGMDVHFALDGVETKSVFGDNNSEAGLMAASMGLQPLKVSDEGYSFVPRAPEESEGDATTRIGGDEIEKSGVASGEMSGIFIDDGDTLPENDGGIGNSRPKNQSAQSMAADGTNDNAIGNLIGRGRRKRSEGTRPNAGAPDDVNFPKESESGIERSTRSLRGTDSVGSIPKDSGSVMGNSSGRERSTRSVRSIGSNSSFGSFYSCQGDLV